MSKTGSTRHVLRATMALLGVLRARPWEVPREALPLPLAGARSRRIHMSSQEGGEGGRPKVIVISGPTGVGKSALAMRLCQRLGGEIISVDSVQVYRKLDIGSNKPSEEERRQVQHHLIDVLEPNSEEVFTAGRFLEKAEEAVQDVWARGKLPMIVGGTSMYTQWLVQGKPDAPRSDPAVEREVELLLEPYIKSNDWEGGLSLLAQKNADRAARLSRNDWLRLGRALEVSLLAGEGAPTFTGERQAPGPYDLRCFFLVAPREPLNRIIDQRCVAMLRSGLMEETAQLLSQGLLDPASPPGRAIGYRQTIEYLRRPEPKTGDAQAFKEYVEAFMTATRRYAKTQMVWFRAQQDFIWVKRSGEDLQQDPVGSLVGVEEAVLAAIEEGRQDHERRKQGGEQAALREENLREGQKMKTYRAQIDWPALCQEMGDRADRCTAMATTGQQLEGGGEEE